MPDREPTISEVNPIRPEVSPKTRGYLAVLEKQLGENELEDALTKLELEPADRRVIAQELGAPTTKAELEKIFPQFSFTTTGRTNLFPAEIYPEEIPAVTKTLSDMGLVYLGKGGVPFNCGCGFSIDVEGTVLMVRVQLP